MENFVWIGVIVFIIGLCILIFNSIVDGSDSVGQKALISMALGFFIIILMPVLCGKAVNSCIFNGNICLKISCGGL